MRNLFFLLFVVCVLFGFKQGGYGVEWDGKVYVSWEITSNFDSAEPQTAYIAVASKRYQSDPYPDMGTPETTNWLAVVYSGKKYAQVSNPVIFNVDNPTDFTTSWQLLFSTESGEPAKVTFKCLENKLPNPEQLTLRLQTADSEMIIDAVQEGSQQTLTVESSASELKKMVATYQVAYQEGVQFLLSLEPDWNLIGIPFQSVAEEGTTLFTHTPKLTVLRVDSAATQVDKVADLVCGRAYWVHNPTDGVVSVKLTGTVINGGNTMFPTLSPGWNYISPIGHSNGKTPPGIKEATWDYGDDELGSEDCDQWKWDETGQFFRVRRGSEPPAVGRGYMVKE